jgi:hypothetical protein
MDTVRVDPDQHQRIDSVIVMVLHIRKTITGDVSVNRSVLW